MFRTAGFLLDYAADVWGFGGFSRVRRKVAMIRFWNKLLILPNNRITKQVFLWDNTFRRNSWSADIKKRFFEMNSGDNFKNRLSSVL